MFRDREGVDCKGNTRYPVNQGLVQGLGAKRLWQVFRILRSSFKVAVSEINGGEGGRKKKKKHMREGRCFFCKAGISLDLFVVLVFLNIHCSLWCNPTHQVSIHCGRSGPPSAPFPCWTSDSKDKISTSF